jgi:tetratricopeptide (TPR) repeat protein
MSRSWPNMGRGFLFSPGGLLLLLLGGTGPLGAQELTLKRDLPGDGSHTCSPIEAPADPGEEERTEAGRLGSSADEALILGEMERARDLLERATELDPTSPEIAYRFARVLEELGDRAEAIDQYCRAIALGSGSAEIGDAPARIQNILDLERAQIPVNAVQSFQAGLSQADRGQLETAFQSFGSAFAVAPDWAEAVYNRGIVQARLGRVEAAASDLEEYLAFRPEAEDALLVSQRIGQLRGLTDLPSPSAALTLGILFPGAGQFYSRRAWGGLSVLTLAAGAAAAGFLIEEVTVLCVGSVPSGGECPPDRVIGEEVDTPYLMHGLVAAGAVTVLGAVESFFGARGRRTREVGALVAMEMGGATLLSPSLSARGPRIHLDLVRVTF